MAPVGRGQRFAFYSLLFDYFILLLISTLILSLSLFVLCVLSLQDAKQDLAASISQRRAQLRQQIDAVHALDDGELRMQFFTKLLHSCNGIYFFRRLSLSSLCFFLSSPFFPHYLSPFSPQIVSFRMLIVTFSFCASLRLKFAPVQSHIGKHRKKWSRDIAPAPVAVGTVVIPARSSESPDFSSLDEGAQNKAQLRPHLSAGDGGAADARPRRKWEEATHAPALAAVGTVVLGGVGTNASTVVVNEATAVVAAPVIPSVESVITEEKPSETLVPLAAVSSVAATTSGDVSSAARDINPNSATTIAPPSEITVAVASAAVTNVPAPKESNTEDIIFTEKRVSEPLEDKSPTTSSTNAEAASTVTPVLPSKAVVEFDEQVPTLADPCAKAMSDAAEIAEEDESEDDVEYAAMLGTMCVVLKEGVDEQGVKREGRSSMCRGYNGSKSFIVAPKNEKGFFCCCCLLTRWELSDIYMTVIYF